MVFGLKGKRDLNTSDKIISKEGKELKLIANIFTGFTIGPLSKKYSYRQVALYGSLLSCSGLILTSRANSMLYIICFYSVLGGAYKFVKNIILNLS